MLLEEKQITCWSYVANNYLHVGYIIAAGDPFHLGPLQMAAKLLCIQCLNPFSYVFYIWPEEGYVLHSGLGDDEWFLWFDRSYLVVMMCLLYYLDGWRGTFSHFLSFTLRLLEESEKVFTQHSEWYMVWCWFKRDIKLPFFLFNRYTFLVIWSQLVEYATNSICLNPRELLYQGEPTLWSTRL